MDAVNNKIVINFGWKGPNCWKGGWSKGGFEVTVVDLLFKGAKTDISVHVPDNIAPVSAQKIPFTCRRYHVEGNSKFLAKETAPTVLNVTVEQIKNLTLKAGFFEKSPISTWTMMDSKGKITREERVLRTDKTIALEVPKDLVIGATYCLEITSKDLDLTARLVAEPAKKEVEKKDNKDEKSSTASSASSSSSSSSSSAGTTPPPKKLDDIEDWSKVAEYMNEKVSKPINDCHKIYEDLNPKPRDLFKHLNLAVQAKEWLTALSNHDMPQEVLDKIDRLLENPL